jgi:hypothetical protein
MHNEESPSLPYDNHIATDYVLAFVPSPEQALHKLQHLDSGKPYLERGEGDSL